jgi:AcrR family transcriptional regulator
MTEQKAAAVQTGQRRRGRPSGDDNPQLRGAILDAAERLFAAQGYSATSVREIAGASGVTPAMIHYYFGNKTALLKTVMERTLEPLATALAAMKSRKNAPAGEISRLLMDTVSRHPMLPVLMVREVMLPGGAMQDYFLEHLAPRLGGALPGMLKNEQQAGHMAAELDPSISAMLLLALSVFPFLVRDVAEKGLGVSFDEPGIQQIQNHVARLLREGMSP